jgi:hypothetical protein
VLKICHSTSVPGADGSNTVTGQSPGFGSHHYSAPHVRRD